MRVNVLTNQQARDFLRRLSGGSEARDLRRALCSAEIRIHRHTHTLTNPKGSFYGETYWMVSAAEWLAKAEAEKVACQARLDEMGERHRTHAEEQTLRDAGVLPPLDLKAELARMDAALRRREVTSC